LAVSGLGEVAGCHRTVFSANANKAYEIGKQIRAGSIWINGGAGKLLSNLPVGGYKRTGIGREYGPGWQSMRNKRPSVSVWRSALNSGSFSALCQQFFCNTKPSTR